MRNMDNLDERDALVKKEANRLKRLFKEIPPNRKKLVEGLIIQAARLRVMLDDMWIDISEGGDYELFSQSEKLDPYERERPVAKLYNSRDGSYQKIISQLASYLPDESQEKAKKDALDGSDLI